MVAVLWYPQRRKSAMLFLKSSELGLPHPSPIGEWEGCPDSNEGTYTEVI